MKYEYDNAVLNTFLGEETILFIKFQFLLAQLSTEVICILETVRSPI